VVRPPDVVAAERREVALCGAPHGRGLRQEVQVEDRHDLRGAPGGEQQRRRRVHDVLRAGQPLDRRPAAAMPAPGERGHGNPAIDHARAGQLGRGLGGDAVAPGG
jgi:hypothetical protein